MCTYSLVREDEGEPPYTTALQGALDGGVG